MGQTNTERISHLRTILPNTFRHEDLFRILNEMDFEEQGAGFSEVIRSGVFTTKITLWASPAKTKKLTETVFNRTGVFVSSIVKQFFDDETGSVVEATVTATFNRTGPFVTGVSVDITRP